jgi:plasmid stabilization system protein ParE
VSGPYHLRYLPAAEQDLLDIWTTSPRTAAAARAFVNRVERAIGASHAFPIRPATSRCTADGVDTAHRGERLLVFHVVVRRTVQIRRVIHGARRYDFLLADG